MKLDQLEQAQHLYFQTDLTKSEIANQLGLSRRAIQYWVAHYDWARQKTNADHLPTFLAENCYHIIGHLQEDILSEDRVGIPCTPQEVNMLHRLTLTVNKLKTRATLNENMETLLRFSDEVLAENPALAEQIAPLIDKYIAAEAAWDYTNNLPSRMDKFGYLKAKDPAVAINEKNLDIDYYNELLEQQKKNAAQSSKPEPLPKKDEPLAENSATAEPCVTPPSPGVSAVAEEGRGEASCPTSPSPLGVNASEGAQIGGEAVCATPPSPLERAGVRPPLTIAEKLRAEELAKPKPDLRKLLRGTSTTGPSKVLRRPIAA